MTDVKKILIGVAATFTVILVIYLLLVMNATSYEREIRSYAEAAIVEIASDWDEQALLRRASPDFFATTDRQEVDEVFNRYRELGPLIHLSRGRGHVDVEYTTTGKKIVAVYAARARFQYGSAAIKLALIKGQRGWQIMGFDITPDSPVNHSIFGNYGRSCLSLARCPTNGIVRHILQIHRESVPSPKGSAPVGVISLSQVVDTEETFRR